MPPPTPVRLPQCNPSLSQDAGSTTVTKEVPSKDGHPDPSSLVGLLQAIHRPNDLKDLHFAALGVHVHADAPPEDLIPDPSFFPAAAGWDGLTIDQARERDPTFRRPLSNRHTSPEAKTYVERRGELSVPNQAAFRTVRRLRPEPGKPLVRLGNCYEFFKQLEFMASYWDDASSLPSAEGGGGDGGKRQDESTPALSSPPGSSSATTSPAQAGSGVISAAQESNARSQSAPDGASQTPPERVTYRRYAGSEMPSEHRHNLVAAFVKLVAYDFGCNVAPSRVEPRLHLLEPPPPSSRPPPPPPPSSSTTTSTTITNKPLAKLKEPTAAPPPPSPPQKSSYFPSGCVFVQRIPTTREAARMGVVEGPVAAVSARNGTSFASPAEARVDLGRELLVALATAQLRARQGKEERRFGEDKWWAMKKRWGGGEGGPIGREVDAIAAANDKDAAAAAAAAASAAGGGKADSSSGSSSYATATAAGTDGTASSSSTTATTTTSTASLPTKLQAAISGVGTAPSSGGVRPIPVRGQPASKKQRKTPTIYDHYRKVQPPSSTWDRKARYEAIGKVRDGGGSGYDDVFVFSSLFHHFCIVRVRVPERLLEVLEGGHGDGRGWDKLEVWRTKWFDLFLVEERLEALRVLWGVLAWLMRRQEQEGGGDGKAMGVVPRKVSPGHGGGGGRDVVMKDA